MKKINGRCSKCCSCAHGQVCSIGGEIRNVFGGFLRSCFIWIFIRFMCFLYRLCSLFLLLDTSTTQLDQVELHNLCQINKTSRMWALNIFLHQNFLDLSLMGCTQQKFCFRNANFLQFEYQSLKHLHEQVEKRKP